MFLLDIVLNMVYFKKLVKDGFYNIGFDDKGDRY